MVPILVVLTIAVLLVVDAFLERRRREVRRTAYATRFDAAQELYVHPAHCWVRRSADGLVSVGSSGFASNFAGSLSAIDLPDEGARLRQGQPAWTLVSRRGRRLSQVMPVSGKVLAVNDALRRDPSLVQKSPYESGWILRVRPRRLKDQLSNLLPRGATTAWRDALRSAVARQLTPSMGVLAHDGGEWIARFGDLLDDETWEQARRELFPAPLAKR